MSVTSVAELHYFILEIDSSSSIGLASISPSSLWMTYPQVHLGEDVAYLTAVDQRGATISSATMREVRV